MAEKIQIYIIITVSIPKLVDLPWSWPSILKNYVELLICQTPEICLGACSSTKVALRDDCFKIWFQYVSHIRACGRWLIFSIFLGAPDNCEGSDRSNDRSAILSLCMAGGCHLIWGLSSDGKGKINLIFKKSQSDSWGGGAAAFCTS